MSYWSREIKQTANGDWTVDYFSYPEKESQTYYFARKEDAEAFLNENLEKTA